jgi:divalent metal cation (Fe/Co/Zn/Cd) transporter
VRPIEALEFPEEVERAYREARRLEWLTLAFVASAAAALYVTMGTSQAMRTNFFDDVISLVPAAAFLVGTALARRAPRPDYPYGTHRATSVAHLTAALALCGMGLFLLADAAAKALSGERPTIGGFGLFGTVVWAGWPMLAAVAYSAVPSALLGRAKARLAPRLHDKVLQADAEMMKADWMAGAATAVGVVGTGFGLWWLDPLAAALVSLDILKDGAASLRVAVVDLVDRRPQKADRSGWERLPDEVRDLLRRMDWVEDAEVRMREEGHILLGEAFVVPRPGTEDLVGKVRRAAEEAEALDWRVHELVVMPVERSPVPASRGEGS